MAARLGEAEEVEEGEEPEPFDYLGSLGVRDGQFPDVDAEVIQSRSAALKALRAQVLEGYGQPVKPGAQHMSEAGTRIGAWRHDEAFIRALLESMKTRAGESFLDYKGYLEQLDAKGARASNLGRTRLAASGAAGVQGRAQGEPVLE